MSLMSVRLCSLLSVSVLGSPHIMEDVGERPWVGCDNFEKTSDERHLEKDGGNLAASDAIESLLQTMQAARGASHVVDEFKFDCSVDRISSCDINVPQYGCTGEYEHLWHWCGLSCSAWEGDSHCAVHTAFCFEDRFDGCERLAENGGCSPRLAHYEYMWSNCAKSCSTDWDVDCRQLADNGGCQDEWMLTYCGESCLNQRSDVDCRSYAMAGSCNSSLSVMRACSGMAES